MPNNKDINEELLESYEKRKVEEYEIVDEYEEVEVIPNCEVQILKCRACGKISIGWKRQKKLTLGFEFKDMQEVVRCSDCKFASSNTTVMTEHPIMRCNIFRAMTDPNGFCYKGERK